SYIAPRRARVVLSRKPGPEDFKHQLLVFGEAMVTFADQEQVHGSAALPGEGEAVVPVDRVVTHPVDDERRYGVSMQEHFRVVLHTIFHQAVPDLQVYPRAPE